jgi:hypothetical protein
MADHTSSEFYGAHIVSDQDPASQAALFRILGIKPPESSSSEAAMDSFFDDEGAYGEAAAEQPDYRAYTDSASQLRADERAQYSGLSDERITDDKFGLWAIPAPGEDQLNSQPFSTDAQSGSRLDSLFKTATTGEVPVVVSTEKTPVEPAKTVRSPLFGTPVKAAAPAEAVVAPETLERRKFSLRTKLVAIGAAVLTIAGVAAGVWYTRSDDNGPEKDERVAAATATVSTTTLRPTATTTTTTSPVSTTTVPQSTTTTPNNSQLTQLNGAPSGKAENTPPPQQVSSATVCVERGDNLTKIVKQQIFGEGSGAIVDGNRILSEIVRQGVLDTAQSNKLIGSKADLLRVDQSLEIRWSPDFQKKVDAGRIAVERLKA